ncbi:MAG: rod-binding protein [Desulfobacterales bacterium]|nr:rod-binding protein [Desulfobacterales bacterium]
MQINSLHHSIPISGTSGEKAETLQKEKDLEKACQGFEAIWLNSIMKSMRDTLPGDSLFPDSNASDIYESLHDQYLTDNLSEGKESIGLKEFLYNQLKEEI